MVFLGTPVTRVVALRLMPSRRHFRMRMRFSWDSLFTTIRFTAVRRLRRLGRWGRGLLPIPEFPSREPLAAYP